MHSAIHSVRSTDKTNIANTSPRSTFLLQWTLACIAECLLDAGAQGKSTKPLPFSVDGPHAGRWPKHLGRRDWLLSASQESRYAYCCPSTSPPDARSGPAIRGNCRDQSFWETSGFFPGGSLPAKLIVEPFELQMEARQTRLGLLAFPAAQQPGALSVHTHRTRETADLALRSEWSVRWCLV